MSNGSKQNLITQKELVDIMNVNKAFVSRNVNASNPPLDVVEYKGRKKIDLDGKKTRAFIKRHGKNNLPDTIDNAPKQNNFTLSLDIEEAAELYAQEKALHKESMREAQDLKNAYMRGELIDREMVYTSVMYYLDTIRNNIERNSNAFLDDVAGRIHKNDGYVSAEIRSIWTDAIRKTIADAKESVDKKILEIQKEQAE